MNPSQIQNLQMSSSNNIMSSNESQAKHPLDPHTDVAPPGDAPALESNGAVTVDSNGMDSTENTNDIAMSEGEIVELLRQMDEANGVAAGLEGRLDELLGNLDGLLVGLESRTSGASNEGRR